MEHWGTNFGRMSMSAILQGGFPSRAHLLLPPIGRGPTHLDACSRSSCLPGLTGLHQREHLSFGPLPLLLLHDGFFPSSLALFSAICPLS